MHRQLDDAVAESSRSERRGWRARKTNTSTCLPIQNQNNIPGLRISGQCLPANTPSVCLPAANTTNAHDGMPGRRHRSMRLRVHKVAGVGACISSRRLTRGFGGRLRAAWRMQLHSPRWLPRRLWRLRPRLKHCLLPLRRAGPPPAARLRRRFLGSAPLPAGSCHTATEGKGRGAGRRAPEPPLRAPNPILQGGIHPRGREEEGDDRGVASVSRQMQRGVAILQGRGRRGRGEG